MQAAFLHWRSAQMLASSSLLLDLSPALLENEILPHLAASDLGSLACTCKQLLAVVTGLDTSIWLKAAVLVLGPHPAVVSATASQPSSSASLRAALLRYSQACQGLRTGSCHAGEPP